MIPFGVYGLTGADMLMLLLHMTRGWDVWFTLGSTESVLLKVMRRTFPGRKGKILRQGVTLEKNPAVFVAHVKKPYLADVLRELIEHPTALIVLLDDGDGEARRFAAASGIDCAPEDGFPALEWGYEQIRKASDFKGILPIAIDDLKQATAHGGAARVLVDAGQAHGAGAVLRKREVPEE